MWNEFPNEVCHLLPVVSFRKKLKYFLILKAYRVRNLKFARNLKFSTSKTLVNFMKKMMFLSKNWYFSVQKALIYYTVNKSHHSSFILLVFSHVANFRYVANFRFLTLHHRFLFLNTDPFSVHLFRFLLFF